MPSALLEKVMGGFLYLTRVRKQVLGLDSSGFSPRHASYYYALKIRRDINSSMRKELGTKR